MYSLFKEIFIQPKNILFIGISSFLFFTFLQILPVFRFIKSTYSISGVTIHRHFEIFYQYVFESFTYISFWQQSVLILISLATACNILLFILFIKRQHKIFIGKGFLGTFVGIFLGLFGVGCVSCGALIVAPLLVLLGLSSYASNIIEHSLLISSVGLAILISSIFYLSRVLSKPLICK